MSSHTLTLLQAARAWLAQRRPRLIPGWRMSWRMLSIQAAAALVLINTLQQLLEAHSFGLPPGWLPTINAVLGAAVIVLRNIDQPALRAAVEAMLGPDRADPTEQAAPTAAEPTQAEGDAGTQQGQEARPPFDPHEGRWR